MLFGKDVEVGHNVIKKKRDEFVVNRGKKTTDRSQTIDNLRLLLEVSRYTGMGVGLELLLLRDVIETTFDIPGVTLCMKTDIWERWVGVVCSRVVHVGSSLAGLEYTFAVHVFLCIK